MSRPSLARHVTLSIALLALAAGRSDAQGASPASSPAADSAATRAEDRAARRGFTDSWFWGVKTGATRFGTASDDRHEIAPLGGIDWLITRSRGALLLSAEQSFFEHTSAVAEPSQPGVGRVVDLRNARRYSATALAVPGMLGRVRPYAGIGLALDVMREVTPRGDFESTAQRGAVQSEIDRGASKASVQLLAGGQMQFGRTALFLQASGAPAQPRSLWNRGGTMQVEFGARYNLLTARER